MRQKLKLVKQPEEKVEKKSYIYTRKALQFLYEENVRNKNLGVSTILYEAITYCDAAMEGRPLPQVKFKDAEECVKFIKGFLALEDDKRLLLIAALSDTEEILN